MKDEWLFWLIIGIPSAPMLLLFAWCWWIIRSDESWHRFLERSRELSDREKTP